jgi:endonuclease III related protein
MNKAAALYRSLLAEFGPQHWWPAKTQYEVVAGALLTQNTNWANVEKAIENLRAAGILSPEAVLGTPVPKLEALIRPCGFFRQKAVRLRLLTWKFVEIQARGTPPTRDELLDVKGVGKETADSILLYAFGLPYFVIDAYTRRFCAHHRLFEGKGYDEYRSFFETSMPRDVQLYKEYHALIVAWGKRHSKIIRRKSKTKKQDEIGKKKIIAGWLSRAGAP